MKNSKISWTDHTFNPWIGCSKVSPGCANCYAAELDRRRYSKTLDGGTKANPVLHFGPNAPRHRTSAANWKQPLKWDREAAEEIRANAERWAMLGDGSTAPAVARPRVFCASLADWLDEEVPIEWFVDLLDLQRVCRHIDWLDLSKRPQNWRERLTHALGHVALSAGESGERMSLKKWIAAWLNGVPPANVWIGTTVEDQQRADERIPVLLSIPARVRFLSCEPLLGPVDIAKAGALGCSCESDTRCAGRCPHYLHALNKSELGVRWVIVGAESGPKRRPMCPTWANRVKTQCHGAGVPFYMKQMEVGGKITDDMEQFPADLRIRQFPEVR